ncbi:hypothetical protein [Leisingera caerulea]|uniref:hypothetical protein n=1 Tax=Leisingera caerulea TaxID=506591 RepID=UPI0021A5DE08|nr:hypothetical protein [Leisingera caerulea]UWQ83089.1 hypothetical protein K3726_15685 [Leisingera caerulea]
MTAQIFHLEPEVEAAIREGKLTQIEITDARMKLSDGVLSLRARDLLPPENQDWRKGQGGQNRDGATARVRAAKKGRWI